MTLTDRIISSSDKIKFLATEKLKAPATWLLVGGSIAGATILGITAGEMLATHAAQADIPGQIYNAMYGAIAGSALGFAISHVSINKITNKLRSLVLPIDGNVNRISAQRLFKNFVDITEHSKHKNMFEKDLIEKIDSTASDAKLKELKEFLERKDEPQAKKMSRMLNEAHSKSFAEKLRAIAKKSGHNQTDINTKTQRAAQSLREFIERAGLEHVKSKSFTRAIEDIDGIHPKLQAKHVVTAFAVDAANTLPSDSLAKLKAELIQEAPTSVVNEMMEHIEQMASRKEPVLGNVQEVVFESDQRNTPALGL